MIDKIYFLAEIKKRNRRRVFLFEIEEKETLEEVVEKNFGEDAQIIMYRFPTAEEKILMSRSMRT